MGVRRNDDVVKGRQRFEVGENVTPRHFIGAFGETGAPHGRLVSLGAVGPQRARVDITGARRTLACHGRASVERVMRGALVERRVNKVLAKGVYTQRALLDESTEK